MISRLASETAPSPNTLAAEADADGIVVYDPPKGSFMKAADPRDRGKRQ